MRDAWAATIPALAKAVRCSESTIKRAIGARSITRTAKGFNVAQARGAVALQRTRNKSGTTKVANGNGGGDPYDEILTKNAQQREELFEWDKRGRRAKALIAEVELAEKSKRVMPIVQMRKAWIANEMLWRENLKTIARQLGARWGGKIGREIEAEANKLFAEMFARMAADPMLRGEGTGTPSAH